MDEPLGALDKQLREHMQFEITRLAHDLGITTVYVTHDQTEALTMSDRVAVFDDGRIQQLAPPDELYESREQLRRAVHRREQHAGRHRERSRADHRRGEARRRRGDRRQAGQRHAEVGERTKVSIRPERVEYNPTAAPTARTRCKAEVLEFIYMGDIFRTRLRVAGNDDFIIKTRNAPDQRRLKPGEQDRNRLAAEDCRALDA
jgi:putative spermidine/putrescine transport system ATP-binding protein